MASLVSRYDVALLDLDGVVYRGSDAVRHAVPSLERARAAGMALAFVTNNAARPPSAVAEHLNDLGIAAAAAEVVTSAQAAARVLTGLVPAGSKVLVVGGPGLSEALIERGLHPVGMLADDPVAVVQGFHPSVDWVRLAEASYAVAGGLPWVASNADRTVPTARGTAPGNGMLVAAVSAATGRRPVVAGKPELPMHREAMDRTGARRPIVVGDRLDTDIEAANRAGVTGLLVLTGVTDAADVALAPAHLRPDLLGADLRSLLQDEQHLRVPTVPPAPLGAGSRIQAQCGRWQATTNESGEVMLQPASVPDVGARGDSTDHAEAHADAVRALCAVAWALRDAGHEPRLADALDVVSGLQATSLVS